MSERKRKGGGEEGMENYGSKEGITVNKAKRYMGVKIERCDRTKEKTCR